MALADYLRDCGYRVMEAASAAEAIALMSAGLTVDLVFTKVRLGGPNGFALANWVRRRFPGTKVLLAGSLASAAEKAESLCANGRVPPAPGTPHDAVLRQIQMLLHRARRAGGGRGRIGLG